MPRRTEGRAEFLGPFFDPERFDAQAVREFQTLVLEFYRAAPRSFPWRITRDPWAVFVSEIMLQQTQTERVLPKYLAFLEAFPTPAALADAPLERLLGLWSGLGYNRRALALKRAALALCLEHGGRLPSTEEGLRALPGVGPYTARAVLAFAFDMPTVFVETNIRTVFLYHFFPGALAVADRRIEALAACALLHSDPRVWYYALMDLGAAYKRLYGNPNARSATYTKQSAFADSHRRVRGAALRELASGGPRSRDELAALLPFSRERVEKALDELVAEGFARERDGVLRVGE